jgi:2-polyprenyl-6-methoxyphenol hydroxylase-like FAD-dependent oxidoreductase
MSRPHSGEHIATCSPEDQIPVLVIGAGVVGCLTAFKLGKAGISTTVIERLPEISNAPRACGYFGAVQLMLDECGLYKSIREEGFMTRGITWRKPPKDDGTGTGGMLFGDAIANLPLCAPYDTELPPGTGILNLPQAQLNELFYREALKTANVTVDFNTEIVSVVSNTDSGVAVLTRNPETGSEKQYNARYAVAADGAKSATRKALKLSYPGHTWPERLIATNVMLKNVEETPMHTHFVIHPVHWGISTPLSDPIMGERSLWRWTVAADPALDHLTDEEILGDKYVFAHYEPCLPGPRPLKDHVEIVARAVYRTHQRLVTTMRKGNFLLAGDAAHCNHVSLLSSLSPASILSMPVFLLIRNSLTVLWVLIQACLMQTQRLLL